MVSLIGWIVTRASYEDSVLTTVYELGFVETTCANSSIQENDISPEVQILLDSTDHDRLCLPEVTSGGKDGFKDNLRERRGKGFCSSMITDLF